jgi:hypothetical protein
MDPHRARKLENHLGGGKSREFLISPDLRHPHLSLQIAISPLRHPPNPLRCRKFSRFHLLDPLRCLNSPPQTPISSRNKRRFIQKRKRSSESEEIFTAKPPRRTWV